MKKTEQAAAKVAPKLGPKGFISVAGYKASGD
ncbi:hypothetical protein CCACVL1_13693 [Corchorus capsularis]|uniref:Uncharacterized protein n=1 Tax=Corchorus capsularis TaxID=210143 RepID=A0A1R3IA16_COCAP|nr:hypothetical protein CCACVL1_13693 [Corchorus capsularis]